MGTVELGTAASSGLEMVFTGIANPVQVQRLIQAERDARIKKANRGNRNSTEFQKTVAAGGE